MTSLLMTSLFQVLAAVMGNVRSLIVESRVSGTTSAEVDDDQEVQRQAVECQSGRHGHTHAPARQACTLFAPADEANVRR